MGIRPSSSLSYTFQWLLVIFRRKSKLLTITHEAGLRWCLRPPKPTANPPPWTSAFPRPPPCLSHLPSSARLGTGGLFSLPASGFPLTGCLFRNAFPVLTNQVALHISPPLPPPNDLWSFQATSAHPPATHEDLCGSPSHLSSLPKNAQIF